MPSLDFQVLKIHKIWQVWVRIYTFCVFHKNLLLFADVFQPCCMKFGLFVSRTTSPTTTSLSNQTTLGNNMSLPYTHVREYYKAWTWRCVTIGRKLSWIILWLKSRAIATPRKINMEPEKKLPGKGKSSEPNHHFQVRFVHLPGCIQNSLRSWECILQNILMEPNIQHYYWKNRYYKDLFQMTWMQILSLAQGHHCLNLVSNQPKLSGLFVQICVCVCVKR